jgi:CRISPR/Cas system-associated endonuclease Cas1
MWNVISPLRCEIGRRIRRIASETTAEYPLCDDPGCCLAKCGETVTVRVEQETKLRVPIHTLNSIVCFGQVSSSPFLMGMCGECRVALAFLSEHGQFLARVPGPVSGNVLLRREQYGGPTAQIDRRR